MKENDNMNRQFDEMMAREIYNYLLDQDFNIIDTTVEILNDEDYGNAYQVTIGVKDGDYNYAWFASIYPMDLGTITFPLDILVDDLCIFFNDNDIDY